jgi:glycosyltransferase involved in cell wall biosynthesis
MRAEESDFSAPRSGRKFVFGTPEYRVLRAKQRGGLISAAELPETVDVITPSRWCALAYERFGLAPDRVHVIPHGIDPDVLHPDERRRAVTRGALQLGGHEQVFLSVGAMVPNKGIDLLLAAFAQIAVAAPDVRLVLKGADGLYPSREFVSAALNELPTGARDAVIRRMIYIGGTYSCEKMADLYRACDVYVAPYRAEGFNLPVLEAAGCGLPVICTAGGPTDEFTDPTFCARIRSVLEHPEFDETLAGDALKPDPAHLLELMTSAARDRDDWREMGVRGARHVRNGYTWNLVTDLLVASFFPPSAPPSVAS